MALESSLLSGALVSKTPTAMKIALIASRLHTGGGRVVGQKIIESIFDLCADEDILAVVPQDADYPQSERANLRVLECPRQSSVRQMWWDRTKLRSALSEFSPDWVWALGNYPISGPWRQSVLIHDPHLMFEASWFKDETTVNKLKKMLGKWLLKRRIDLPQRFYCQTEAIRARVASQIGIRREKIGFCPPGIEPPVPPAVSPKVEQLFEKLDEKHHIFFYPARCYAHKNHRLILETYRKYRSELSDTRCVWTIAPEQHVIATELLDDLDRSKLDDLILNVGPLSRGEVAACFGRSDALVMPTKLETFGIPFIEAMQHKVAIIASDYDFVRAVCGDAALYIKDPDDPAHLFEAITRLRDDSSVRAELIRKANDMVENSPSWHEVVQRVLVDEELLSVT